MKTRKIVVVLFVLLLAVAAGVTVKYDLLTKVKYIGSGRGEAVFYLLQMIRKDGILSTVNAVRNKLTNDPRLGLGYSLYDPASYPPVESAAARNGLPEFRTIPAVDVATLPTSRTPALSYDTWYRSNGDELSSKYSALDQIHGGNVQDLEVAWKYAYASSMAQGGARVESNPVVINGRLFVASVDNHLLSLDAATGREIWRVELPAPAVRRGLVWEPNTDFASSRVFVPTARGVYALNAATGEILRNFGNNGEVGDQLSTIAPVIAGDKLVVGIVKPALEAYDRRSGKLLWTTPLLETAKGSGVRLLTGGSPWAGMSYDAARSRVYVSTGNPRPELWGISRPGANKHSSSVVAVDVATGQIVWSFQEVAHDLWDLDVSSPPVLTTIVKNGKRIDVVAAVTKAGNTLLLDRDLGQPIFDYRMRRAPASTIPGEQTSPYQPDLQLPEPFLKQVFEPVEDVTDLSESSGRSVRQKIRTASSGFFVPPVLGGSVVLYGLGGGALWPGAAVDQRTGILYIPSNQTPWIVRANYRDLRGPQRAVTGMRGNEPYQALCARCHGPARDGFQEPDPGLYYPALTGITVLRRKEALTSKVLFAEQHQGLDMDVERADRELDILFDYFAELDGIADADKAFAARTFWGPLQDSNGNPGSKPPWGLLTALDLNSGRKIWQVPFGEYANVLRNGKPVQGQLNTGGAIVTAGGLLFATGTLDHRVRAYDSASGRELWSFVLTEAGSAPPTTYMLDGRQYVAIVASSPSREEVVAFKLPP